MTAARRGIPGDRSPGSAPRGVPGGRPPGSAPRVTSRDARFQQWQALLSNRAKRQRSGQFIVQGVRPITLAVRHGWQIRALLYDADGAASRWAREMLDTVAATKVAVSADLMHELGEKTDASPELLAVVALPDDDLARIPAGNSMLTVVLDRPASPGNIGTLVRSADAFGASGVVVTGHAADVYDPRSVRASTGSLFSVPVVRVPSHRAVLDWADAVRASGIGVRLVGTDENGDVDVADVDLTLPTMLLVGTEATGLSVAWREACDDLARIPMLGAASSLNAATAASVALYESARQRNAAGRGNAAGLIWPRLRAVGRERRRALTSGLAQHAGGCTLRQRR